MRQASYIVSMWKKVYWLPLRSSEHARYPTVAPLCPWIFFIRLMALVRHPTKWLLLSLMLDVECLALFYSCNDRENVFLLSYKMSRRVSTFRARSSSSQNLSEILFIYTIYLENLLLVKQETELHRLYSLLGQWFVKTSKCVKLSTKFSKYRKKNWYETIFLLIKLKLLFTFINSC